MMEPVGIIASVIKYPMDESIIQTYILMSALRTFPKVKSTSIMDAKISKDPLIIFIMINLKVTDLC